MTVLPLPDRPEVNDDLRAAVLDLQTAVVSLTDVVEAQAATIDRLATAQGNTTALLVGASGHLATIAGEVQAIKAKGLRRWLADARADRKSQG